MAHHILEVHDAGLGIKSQTDNEKLKEIERLMAQLLTDLFSKEPEEPQ